MNILIPHSWLKEFLNTEVSPKKMADCLSLCGPSVEKIEKIGHDSVFDIEITTNRVDMMSVNGIAREAAAILPQFKIKAKLKKDIYRSINIPGQDLPSFPLKVTLDHQLCPRFTAVVIKNVTVKPSPQKIKDRLEKSNIRSLNNVIDIANYLMLAYGQPIHTFDSDKIKDKMILRLSKKGETLVTLDGKKHSLPGGDIVIEDAGNRLIDLCGIMGGLNTAVDQNTKNVLLFVQTYNPKHIRQTSMKLGHRTEAAQLFEKSLDPELVMPVLIQGIKLFKKLTGGEQGSQIIDIYPQPSKGKTASAPLQLIKDRLGINISPKEVSRILNSLGFKNKFKEKFIIQIPSWRVKDVNLPEDIVEEVARIYGYHRLPSLLMATLIPTNYPDEYFVLEHQIKTWLTGMGLNETYTNSLVSETFVKQSSYSPKSHLKIKNAMSEEWQYMRRSLIPSHLEALNQNPHLKNITFFEIAHTYHPKPKSLPEERLELIISSKQSFTHLKGIIETLFAKLHLQSHFKPQKDSAEILIKNQPVGTLGPSNLNPEVQIAILQLKPILKLAQLYPQYQSLSAYPPIFEDMTFTLPTKTYLGKVIDTIKKTHKLIQSVELTKTYQKNHTFNITYQSQIQALNDKMIAPIRKKIVANLSRKFRAKLVGKL